MKKTFFLLSALLFISTPVLAQFDPPTANLTVINATQDNGDALATGANPGDVLRFQYEITSNSDVFDYTPTISLAPDFAGTVDDLGEGSMNNGDIVFPVITNGIAPFSQSFTFFVRVAENCGGQTTLSMTPQDGFPVDVQLNNCSQTGGEGSCYGPNGCGDLSSTGPQTTVISLILGIMGLFAIGFLLSKRV